MLHVHLSCRDLQSKAMPIMPGEDADVLITGREIRGALAGRRITDDTDGQRKLLQGAREKGWEIWLPRLSSTSSRGLSLDGDDSSFRSAAGSQHCPSSDWCVVGGPPMSISCLMSHPPHPCRSHRRVNSSLRPPALRSPNLHQTAFCGSRRGRLTATTGSRVVALRRI